MRVPFFFIVCFNLFLNVKGQNPDELINVKDINSKYLEHLIKQEIDQVRKSLGLNPLLNDSILYLASMNQCNYLQNKQSLSHFQNHKEKWQTPQKRADYFGAKNYVVGENIVAASVAGKFSIEGQNYTTYSYGGMAKTLAALWTNSKPHYANIKTATYTITGVAIVYNTKNQSIICTQTFAKVKGPYFGKASPNSFPYSDPNSAYIPSELIWPSKHKKHAYGIKENRKDKFCNESRTSIFNENTIEIQAVEDSFYLVILAKDIPQIKNYFKHKKDGISIEIEFFKHNYSCNIQDLLIRPTRTNGLCEFNGIITPPLFKDAILDSINSAQQRLPRKLKRKELLWVNIGKIPDEAYENKTSINLIIYSHNRVCKILEGKGICGAPLFDLIPKIPFKNVVDTPSYFVNNATKSVKLKIPFEKNQIDFNHKYIDKKIKGLQSPGFDIKYAKLEAYASIEGNPEKNESLFKKRADVIIRYINQFQSTPISYKLKTTENWKMFFHQIKNTSDSVLLNWDTLAIRNFVNDTTQSNRLEPLLAKQRYVYAHFNLGKTLSINEKFSLAEKEYLKLMDLENKKSTVNNKRKLNEIQNYLLFQIANNQIPVDHLTTRFPKDQNIKLKRLLFEAEYNPYYINSNELFEEFMEIEKNGSIHDKDFSYYLAIAGLNANIYSFKDEIRNLKKVIPYVQKNFSDTTILQKLQIRLNQNIVYLFYDSHSGRYKDVQKAKSFLMKYYDSKLKTCTPNFAFRIALHYTYMEELEEAMRILTNLIERPNYNPEHYQQYLRTYYFLHSTNSKYADYELKILDGYSKLTQEQWCNLFVTNCNITLPIFRNQAIKNLYCEACGNNY